MVLEDESDNCLIFLRMALPYELGTSICHDHQKRFSICCFWQRAEFVCRDSLNQVTSWKLLRVFRLPVFSSVTFDFRGIQSRLHIRRWPCEANSPHIALNNIYCVPWDIQLIASTETRVGGVPVAFGEQLFLSLAVTWVRKALTFRNNCIWVTQP